MNRKNLNLYILLAVFALVAACAITGQSITPKQQATLWMDTYNAQYDDVAYVLGNPASLPEQKTVARQKKAVLVEVWPLLTAYVQVVDRGGTPSAQDVAAINNLISQLTATAGRH